MKKIIIFAVLATFVFASTPVFAQKGASEQGREHASDQAIFNRVGDWFATIGKNKEEKAKIKAQRSAKRAAKKAERKANKAKDELEDGAEEAKEKIHKESRRAAEKVENEVDDMKDAVRGRGAKE